MKPPTLQQVEDYIREQGFHVNPVTFIGYYEDADPPWTDKKGHPVKNWKQKIRMVWEPIALKGRARVKCWCGKSGVYEKYDDTGQKYFLCIDHKPKPKSVPEIVKTIKFKDVPDHKVNYNNERNRQIRDLMSK